MSQIKFKEFVEKMKINLFVKIFRVITIILTSYYSFICADTDGTTITGSQAIQITTRDLMLDQKITRYKHSRHIRKRKEKNPLKRGRFDRHLRPQFPKSPEISTVPFLQKNDSSNNKIVRKKQRVNLSFDGTTLAEAGHYPPDSMGDIGPTQFITFVNGRIKSFNKNTGSADKVLNIDPDIFFSSIANGIRTADPRIRYDRFTERWFLTCINVKTNNNRVLLGVSNDSSITSATIWNFFYIDAGEGVFFDYPTLGIDTQALYIGGDAFSKTDSGKLFVVKKNSLTNGGPIVYTSFNNFIDKTTNVGMYIPQGVDNFDSNATSGYFIGVDNAFFGRLVLRRVNNPGSNNPTLSNDINVIVPTTQFSIKVPHLGNVRGVEGQLDGLDDRLMCAHIRNGRLWTTHNVGVTNAGSCPSSFTRVTRNGCRWYEIALNGSSAELIQAGTVYHETANNTTNAKSYWMPSIMSNVQGHVILGCSVSGPQDYVNAISAARFSNTPLGKMHLPKNYTFSGTSYNPPADPGSRRRGRRWGDYSYTTVDASNDKTLWTIQEYCNDINSWAVRVAKIIIN